MMSLALTPAFAAGVSSIGATTLKAVLYSDLDTEAAEFAARLHL
jgi:hypothetical protein